MPWFLSRWWNRKANKPKAAKPAKSFVKRAQLELEKLEKRDLFSVGVWLQPQLSPLSGTGQVNPVGTLFQPVVGNQQLPLELANGNLSVAGGFLFTNTGSYDLTLSQAGPYGDNEFLFTESGTVSFSLSVSGSVSGGGFAVTSAVLTQTVALDWLFQERDGATIMSQVGDHDTFEVVTSGSALDPYFWVGFNWYAPTQHIVSTHTLPLFGLAATSVVVLESGNEDFTFAIGNGSLSYGGSGTSSLDGSFGETGQQSFALNSGQTFVQTRAGDNTFTLSEHGTYNGGYVFGTVDYDERGSGRREHDARGTVTQSGTATTGGN